MKQVKWRRTRIRNQNRTKAIYILLESKVPRSKTSPIRTRRTTTNHHLFKTLIIEWLYAAQWFEPTNKHTLRTKPKQYPNDHQAIPSYLLCTPRKVERKQDGCLYVFVKVQNESIVFYFYIYEKWENEGDVRFLIKWS